MVMRSLVFVLICAPVWFSYARTPLSTAVPLPTASVLAWTGVNAVLCFAAPAGRLCERALPRATHGRRVRVRRRAGRDGRVPTLRLIDAVAAGPVGGRPAVVDAAVWAHVRRAMAGPEAGCETAVRANRRNRRRGVVRFFDGRLTLCGVGGVLLENPTVRRSEDALRTGDAAVAQRGFK